MIVAARPNYHVSFIHVRYLFYYKWLLQCGQSSVCHWSM